MASTSKPENLAILTLSGLPSLDPRASCWWTRANRRLQGSFPALGSISDIPVDTRLRADRSPPTEPFSLPPPPAPAGGLFHAFVSPWVRTAGLDGPHRPDPGPGSIASSPRRRRSRKPSPRSRSNEPPSSSSPEVRRPTLPRTVVDVDGDPVVDTADLGLLFSRFPGRVDPRNDRRAPWLASPLRELDPRGH